jgi:hypothetical protein
LSQYPTTTLRKVCITYDEKGRRFIEDNAITKIKNRMFETERSRDKTPSQKFTQFMKYSSNF